MTKEEILNQIAYLTDLLKELEFEWNYNRQLPAVCGYKSIEVMNPAMKSYLYYPRFEDVDYHQDAWVDSSGFEFSSEADLDSGFKWRWVKK